MRKPRKKPAKKTPPVPPSVLKGHIASLGGFETRLSDLRDEIEAAIAPFEDFLSAIDDAQEEVRQAKDRMEEAAARLSQHV